MNLANRITLLRVALIPVFLVFLYVDFTGSNYVAMGVFIAAALTDIADGIIARKQNQVTDFGKFMDPLADKILVVAAMLWFVEQGTLPAWTALIVIVREFMVTALRLIAVDNGRVIAAAISGKVKTVVTIICLSTLFVYQYTWIVYSCVGLITATTVVSGVEYFMRNRDLLKLDK